MYRDTVDVQIKSESGNKPVLCELLHYLLKLFRYAN